MAKSAQEFIKALKAPQDPPLADGPSKVEIASNAWYSSPFYIPNKEEVIADWALTRLLKEKDRERDANPLRDARYWDLLRDVFVVSSDSHKANRPIKTWLLPLLNRIPIAPITASLLNLLAAEPLALDSTSVSHACQCLCLLWPLAVPKFNTDSLVDCFGAVLNVLQRTAEGWSEYPMRLANLIIGSYSSAVSNPGNRKKIYLAFVQHHLRNWLDCIASEYNPDPHSVLQIIYNAGIETIFNTDVLRTEQNGSLIDGPVNGLLREAGVSVVRSLPRLFASYEEATRKHRGTLFGQGSNQAPGASLQHARKAGIKFYASCEALLNEAGETLPVWQARFRLLQIVDVQAVYTASDEAAEDVLRRVGNTAITALLKAIQENDHTRGDHVLSVLSVLVHIDYDVIGSALPATLPKILLWPTCPESGYAFLDGVLEYHTKTRSMDSLLELHQKACTSHDVSETPADIRSSYVVAVGSPLLAHAYLDKLSKALYVFLTPGQVPDVSESIFRSFSDVLEKFMNSGAPEHADGDEGSKKKRRKSNKGESITISTPSSSDHYAQFVSLLANLTAVSIRSLPLHTLLHDVRQDVHDAIRGFYTTIQTTTAKGMKRLRKEDGHDTWPLQIVLTATLHLQYELESKHSLHLQPIVDSKALSKMSESLKSEALCPELRVELLRVLFNTIVHGFSETTPIFETILDTIEPCDQEVTWTGYLRGLHERELPIALFYLLVERWLPLFDRLAPNELLARFTKLLLNRKPSVSEREEAILTMANIWLKTLRNAEFWELPRIRNAMLARMNELTTEIGPNALNAQSFSISAVYQLLMWMPMDYLTRATRTEFLRQAITIDLKKEEANWQEEEASSILVLREYLRRMFSHVGAADHMSVEDYLRHLIRTPVPRSNYTTFTSVTLDLVAIHILSSLRAAVKSEGDKLKDLIAWFEHCSALNNPPEQVDATNMHVQSLEVLVNTLMSGFNVSQFGEDVVQALTQLRERITTVLLPQMISLVNPASPLSICVASLYHTHLVLRRWLRSELGSHLPHFGAALANKIMLTFKSDTNMDSKYCEVALCIAQEELHETADNMRADQLGITVAVYLSFCNHAKDTARTALNACMSRFCKTLSLQNYAAILDFIWEGLCDKTLHEESLINLVHLTGLLMHDSPEGSLKVTQNHWTRCLGLFADRSVFLEAVALQTEVLKLIANKLNNRPASLRQQDLSGLWSILGSCLAGSHHHDHATSHQIFQELIFAVNALVRLRRDLVVSTLPHLGMILRRLILCLRHIQPNLGAKQSRIVTDSLPRWISAATPLSVEDSKAVARLLTTLTIKTTVRSYYAPETEKAESLARPFSKHASPVLKAYVEAMNDPLSFLPADARRELQPGLFALCEIMGEDNRNAMMVSMEDAGGKTVFKALWKEYEKERYTGKG